MFRKLIEEALQLGLIDNDQIECIHDDADNGREWRNLFLDYCTSGPVEGEARDFINRLRAYVEDRNQAHS